MDLASFLLQPMQRITRYPLLIKNILKYTTEDHLDHLLLTEALESAEGFLGRINEAIREGESREKLQEVQMKLAFSPLAEGLDMSKPTKYMGPRQLLHEGNLRKAKSGRRLYGYLCNDVLLLFVPRKTSIKALSPDWGQEMQAMQAAQSNSSFLSGAVPGGNWDLYHAPIALEHARVRVDDDDLKFTLVVSTPLPSALLAYESSVPAHLQPSAPPSQQVSLITVKTSHARERRAWVAALDKAIEAVAKAPRAHGMRTSVRPPLEQTIGTMTIRVQDGLIHSRAFGKRIVQNVCLSGGVVGGHVLGISD